MLRRTLSLIFNSLGVLLFLFHLPLSAQASRGIDLRKLLLSNPGVLKMQLQAMLSRRCAAYTREPIQCREATQEAVSLLDIHPILLYDNGKAENYIVNFKSNLDTFPSTDVMLFLTELESKLTELNQEIKFYGFVAPEIIQPVDLGKIANKYFKSPQKAWKVLATLFQDIEPSLTQIHYLNRKIGKTGELKKLYSVIHLLTHTQYIKDHKPFQLMGYPLPNTKIYHALVPAYISSELQAKGYSNKVSFAIPYFLNYIYEIAEIEGTFKAYFVEPSRIENYSAIQDIHAAEVGALAGLGLLDLVESEANVRQVMRLSPMSYLYQLIRLRIK